MRKIVNDALMFYNSRISRESLKEKRMRKRSIWEQLQSSPESLEKDE